MDYNESYKFNATKKAAIFMNASVLLYHILCTVLFIYLGNFIMSVIGILYIFVYFFMFYLIRLDKYFFTIIFLTIDMSIFNTFLCILLGWEYGFQLYIFIGIIAAFYVKYLTLRKTFTFSYVMSTLCLLEFILLKLYCIHNPIPATNLTHVVFFVNTVFTFFTIIFLMMDFLKNIKFYEGQLLKLSQKDALTGMNNRHNMNTILSTLYDDAKYNNLKFCLGMVDIDDFKKINDSYGHECGDYVLQTIGHMLISMESHKNKTARWGGEEFLVTHIYDKDFEGCFKLADKFRRQVADFDFEFVGKHFPVTVTIGLADFNPEMSLHELIRSADDNLYIGKGNGKNQVVK